MIHNKLVRDKIPEIIADSGKRAMFRVAEKKEMQSFLLAKLHEEVYEFTESKSIEELADIAEVLLAMAECISSIDEFEEAFSKKRKERGAFERRIVLIESGVDT